VCIGEIQGGQDFFFERRSKKLLRVGARLAGSVRKGKKFFGSFFQERTAYFLNPTV
jgi:hypothetical protein